MLVAFLYKVKMKKKAKITLVFVIFLIFIAFTLIFINIYNIRASIENETPDHPSYPVGIQRWSDENGEWVLMWNNVDDYYFNASSGIQFSNNYNEFWSHNIFCGGYFNPSTQEWVYDCLDELPFNWELDTDNKTYANITGWKDKTIQGRTARIWIRYHLKPNDKNLTIQMRIKNIGELNIPYDLGFAWHINDIKISNDYENDWLYINNTWYDLTQIDSMNNTDGHLWLYDIIEDDSIHLWWNENLNHKVWTRNTTQYNAPSTLMINVGPLTVGQSKETEMFWIDASPETLVPEGPDVSTEWDATGCTTHADCVNETPANDADYLQEDDTDLSYDTWNLENSSELSGVVITGVKLYVRNKRVIGGISPPVCEDLYIIINSSGTMAFENVGVPPASYAYDSYEWTTDPATSSAWTQEAVDNLIIGVRGQATTGFKSYCDPRVSHVYVEVSYEVAQDCDVVSSSKTLTADDNCQNITSDNIILDCDGYKIIDTQASYSTDWGVIASGLDNVTIKNCNITHYRSGIDLSGTNNSLIQNTTIYDIQELGHNGDGTGYGIKLDNSQSNNMTNLTLEDIGGTCDKGETVGCIYDVRGISLDSDSDDNLINNTNIINISHNTDGAPESGVYSASIYVPTGCDRTTISNVDIDISTYDGILFRGDGGSIDDAIIDCVAKYGIYSFDNNDITNILIDDEGDGNMEFGLYLVGSDAGDNSEIHDITIQNLTGGASYGLHFDSATNWNLYNINLINNNYQLAFYWDSDNNNISNSTLSNPIGADIKTPSGSSSTGNNLINVTFDHSNISIENTGDEIFVKWYMQVNITNETDYEPQIATVNVTDTEGNTPFYDNSGEDGLTSIFEVFQGHLNGTSPYEWNYTTSIIVNETGYDTNTTSLIINKNYIPYDVILVLTSAYCWTYDSINKFLAIPSGCLYYCEGTQCVI